MGTRLANPPPDADPADEQAVRQLDPAHRGVAESRTHEGSRSCIDYVVRHELCHAVHDSHDKQFYELRRHWLPAWEQRKPRLERLANGPRVSRNACVAGVVLYNQF